MTKLQDKVLRISQEIGNPDILRLSFIFKMLWHLPAREQAGRGRLPRPCRFSDDAKIPGDQIDAKLGKAEQLVNF